MPRNFLDRRYRIVTVLLALASLLFMQIVIAGYACKGNLDQAGKLAVIAPMVQSDLPCDGSMTMTMTMDSNPSTLCHAHCKADPQTADKYQVPAVPSVAGLASDFSFHFTAPAPVGALLQAPLLRRTTAPPLAVRNCCFRI
jgi:hypothetical protein